MTDFVKSLKRTVRSAITDTVNQSDVAEIINDTSSDWKELMMARAANGFTFLDVEFTDGERVYIFEKHGKTTYDIDDPKHYTGKTVIRSYPVAQFYNSETFQDAVGTLFPGCQFSIHYIGDSRYTFRISW